MSFPSLNGCIFYTFNYSTFITVICRNVAPIGTALPFLNMQPFPKWNFLKAQKKMCMCVQSYPVLWDFMDCSSVHGFFQAKNTRMACHFLLWKIVPIQGSNPRLLRLLHWQADSLPLSHLGSSQKKKMVYVKSIFHIIYVADFVFLSDHNIFPIPFGFFQNDVSTPPPRTVIHALYHLESR